MKCVINLTIYQVHVGKAQYAIQILKGKYLVDSNFIRSYRQKGSDTSLTKL